MRGPFFCTYEETAIAAEYSKLLGLEEVEAFLLLAWLPISEYRYSLLRKACQFREFILYLRSMRIRIQHFLPLLFRIRFRNQGCNHQKFLKFYNLKKSYFSNKNLHEGRPRYRRSLLPFKKSSAYQNYYFEVLNFTVFLFLWVIFAHLDPDPDSSDQKQCVYMGIWIWLISLHIVFWTKP